MLKTKYVGDNMEVTNISNDLRWSWDSVASKVNLFSDNKIFAQEGSKISVLRFQFVNRFKIFK